MNKNIIKTIALSAIMCASLTVSSYAEDSKKTVEIAPVFTEQDGQWYPGRIQSNDFAISNNGDKVINIEKLFIGLTSCRNYITEKVLDANSKEFKATAENSIVTLRYKENILFEKTLQELISDDGVALDEKILLNPNSNVKLNMTIDMDGDEITNNAQAIESVFSIGLNYKVDDDKVVNPDDTVKPTPNPDNNTNNGAGGSTGKLPQTGGLINSTSLTLLGLAAVGSGLLIGKKSSSKKGGKIDE